MEKNCKNQIIIRKQLDDLIHNNLNFERSNIQNTIVKNSIFENCNFNRSNIVSLRIENCVFNNCDIKNADLFFCKIINCKFKNCSFDLSDINNTNFSKCILDNCSFISGRISENLFFESDLIKLVIKGSTTKFNDFKNCKWLKSIYGDCTIDYNMIEDCIFENSYINVEALGSSFGLKKSMFKNIKYLSLGRKQIDSNETIEKNIEMYFIEKKSAIELFVYEYSFKNGSILHSAEKMICCLKNKFEENEYILPDEFTYLYKILKLLREKNMLPLIMMNDILLFIKNTIEFYTFDNIYFEKILLFYNQLRMIRQSMIIELNSCNENLLLDNKRYIFKLTFNKKPNQSIKNIISEVYTFVEGKPSEEIKIVREEKGSYIVFLQMTIATLAAFNIGIYLLTGCVKKLVKLRAACEILVADKLPKECYLEVLKDDNSLKFSKKILGLSDKRNIEKLPENLKNLSLDGINSENFIDIKKHKKFINETNHF